MGKFPRVSVDPLRRVTGEEFWHWPSANFIDYYYKMVMSEHCTDYIIFPR